MTRLCPLIICAPSLARKAAAAAISSISPKRCTGIWASFFSARSPDQYAHDIGVMTTVGEMAFVVIPYCPHSRASVLVTESSPALLAE